MNIINLLVPMSLMLGLGFAFFFAKAVRSGLFDDCETPAYRMLDDGDEVAERPDATVTPDSPLSVQTSQTNEVKAT